MPNISCKTQLETRAAKLTARLTQVDAELDVPSSKDWEDLATEREADEVLKMIGLSGQQELRQIAVALNRLAQGTYGVCAKCGDDIVAQRLDLLPDTPFCARCAVSVRERSYTVPNSKSDLTELAKVTTDLLVARQTATLRALGVEMQGLAQMISGAVCAHQQPWPTDDEVEQGFENMPV